jgi:hypothetical protein
VGVVDGQHQRPVAGLLVQPVDRPAEQPGGGERGGRVGRQDLGQAAERQPGAGDVRRGGVHGVVLGRQARHGLAEQAALADAGAAAENQAALRVSRRDRAEPGQLVGTTDESPVLHGASISRSVTFRSRHVPRSRMSKSAANGE